MSEKKYKFGYHVEDWKKAVERYALPRYRFVVGD